MATTAAVPKCRWSGCKGTMTTGGQPPQPCHLSSCDKFVCSACEQKNVYDKYSVPALKDPANQDNAVLVCCSKTCYNNVPVVKLAKAEAKELEVVEYFKKHGKLVEFGVSGRLSGPPEALDVVSGLFKVTLPPTLKESFTDIHEQIKTDVPIDRRVAWAGEGQDLKRLRCFGFLDKDRLTRLQESGVRLHASEKVGEAAIRDELANKRACTVLTHEWKVEAEAAAQSLLNLFSSPAIITPTPTVDDLIALQPNLHNGTAHLGAHLDYPHHEGFGKVICTIAVRGAATILLLEKEETEIDSQGNKYHRTWKFRLNEGEAYVLSGNARNRVLHAVLADENANGNRESLNLRFGLHTAQEAEDVVRYWQEDDI